MAESPVIGLRCPQSLLSQIDEIASSEGKSRSEVMLFLIRRGLGLETGADTKTILERLEQLEGKLLASKR